MGSKMAEQYAFFIVVGMLFVFNLITVLSFAKLAVSVSLSVENALFQTMLI